MYTVLLGEKPTGVWARAAFLQTSLRGVEQRCPLPMAGWLPGWKLKVVSASAGISKRINRSVLATSLAKRKRSDDSVQITCPSIPVHGGGTGLTPSPKPLAASGTSKYKDKHIRKSQKDPGDFLLAQSKRLSDHPCQTHSTAVTQGCPGHTD